jgi:hypothetical protein
LWTPDYDPIVSPRRESGLRPRAGKASSRSGDTVPPEPEKSSPAPSSGRNSGRGKRERERERTPQSTGPDVERAGPRDMDYENARNGAAPIGASAKGRKRRRSTSSSPGPGTEREVLEIVGGPEMIDGEQHWEVLWKQVWLSGKDLEMWRVRGNVHETKGVGSKGTLTVLKTWEPAESFKERRGGKNHYTAEWVAFKKGRKAAAERLGLDVAGTQAEEIAEFIVEKIVKGPKKMDGVNKWCVSWADTWVNNSRLKKYRGSVDKTLEKRGRYTKVRWKKTWEPEESFELDSGGYTDAWVLHENAQ